MPSAKIFYKKKISVSRDFIYFIVPGALLPAVPGLALLYHIQKCLKSNKVVLSCLVLSCLVLSCLVLSCLVLSCLNPTAFEVVLRIIL